MKKIFSILIICAMAAVSCLATGQGADVSHAADDSNGNEVAADLLTVSVGYAGLEQTVRKTYTVAQLKALGEVKARYTWIDKMPAPCLNPAKGARLTDILSDSGIDVASISRIHFTCSDAHETEELTSPYLFDQTKYYYPNLFEHWNYKTQSAEFGAEEGAKIVDTIIAYEDVWQRISSHDEEHKTFDDMTGDNRFRLVFGMTDTVKQTAYNSAKWIHSIEVTLAGAPPKEDEDEKGDQTDKTVGSEKGDKPDTGKDGSEADKEKKDKEAKEKKDKEAKKKLKEKKAKEKLKDKKSEIKTPAGASASADKKTTPGAVAAGMPTGSAMMIPLDTSGGGATSTDAGYQPWRVHELSEEAVAMNAPAPLGEDMGGATAGAMGGFLLLGGAWQFALIRRGFYK